MDQHENSTVAAALDGRLPGPANVTSGVPVTETAAFVAAVLLLGVPALLATQGSPLVLATVVALAAVVTWLCVVRRVAVGPDWVADRRFWGYRVTGASSLRAVTFVENGHGGLLKLHPHAGRPHRLRRPEFGNPAVRTALTGLVTTGSLRLGSGVPDVLGLSAPPAALAAG